MIKNGTRLRSQVCDTQVIVVRSTDSLDELRAGGAPMVPMDGAADRGDPDPRFSEGTQIGKRYTSEDGAEVLVTRAGAGSLTIGEAPMAIKAPKPLPASD